MDLRSICALVLIWLCLVREIIPVNRKSASRGYLINKTILTMRQSCSCPLSFSCSCCQSVMILYTRKEKDLCVNFTYQRNGLNMDIALSSETISSRTVTNFRAFQFCVNIPGCLFSTACVNILELNRFPSSITACLRLDIYAKKQLWQITYNCISVSMELPMMSPTDTSRTDITIEETTTVESTQSSMTESMTESITESMTEPMTETASSEMPSTMETSEMNVMETSEEVEDITALDITSVKTIPIK